MSYLDKQGLEQVWVAVQEKLSEQQEEFTRQIEEIYSYGDTLPETGTEGQLFFLYS